MEETLFTERYYQQSLLCKCLYPLSHELCKKMNLRVEWIEPLELNKKGKVLVSYECPYCMKELIYEETE